MAGRSALLWAAVYVPAAAVLLVVADTAVRFTNPLVAMSLGFAAFWGSSEVLDRLTAPLHTNRIR